MLTFKRIVFAFFITCLLCAPVEAKAPLKIACAANFTSAMQELAKLYQADSGKSVHCTFASTGMLYGQIVNGAPYDLFFAADEERPKQLFSDRYAEEPVVYVKGRVVVWSSTPELQTVADWKEVVSSPSTVHVGIATPKTAPYGLAAENALASAGISLAVKPKLVYGKNVGTAFHYAYSGAAQASFVALSQALSEKGLVGRYWDMPEAALVNQAACALTRGDVVAAQQFLDWLGSEEARAIITKYGYE